MNLEGKNVAVIGLGMMGGAFANGLKKLNPDKLSAYDINQEIIEEALEDRVIDFGTVYKDELKKVLNESDLVFICLYPKATVEFLKNHMDDFKKDSIITDIAGIKTPIVEVLEEILRDDITYIPGHPMAGSEKEGYGTTDTIFKNRNYVLVPIDENPKARNYLKKILGELGFTNIVETTAHNHDEKIAYTSQLCHVIASALIDSENDLTITDFEGGSFGELTRIAMINAPMWTEIFIENKDLLVEQIEEFEDSMQKLKEYIKDSDEDNLKDTLYSVRNKRVAMEVDRINKHQKDS